MICACCGFEIDGKMHRIDRGYVCDGCWDDENNFFPERMLHSEKWKNYSKLLQSENHETIEVPVIKIRQKSVTLYAGKLPSKDVLKMYGVCGFDEGTLSGYQRELYESKINDIYEYLIKCPIAVMPAIFISLRSGVKFNSMSETSLISDDIGTLTIPLEKGSIWIIDGQHRVGSFEKVFGHINFFENSKDLDKDVFVELMDYELPVIFIDSQEATEFLSHLQSIKASPEDIERTVFFIINKTQNRISPSLRDSLQYCIKRAGVDGIPTIEREKWRTEATSLVIDINNIEGSPFFGKINISGARGLGRPIQLHSFVTSMKTLFDNELFLEMNSSEKLHFILSFWEIIKSKKPKAFSEKTFRNYLILKTIGIYSLNMLSSDYLKWCSERKLNFQEKDNIKAFLNPIIDFDWDRSTSSIAHFGGLGGVREVHSLLLQEIKKADSSIIGSVKP